MRLLTQSFAVAALSIRLRRRLRRTTGALAAVVGLAGASACGPAVDLAQSATLVDIQSGYYDMGIINGKTKLVPQATVHIKNVGDRALPGFQISASYWLVGDDGMKDEMIVQHLVAKDLAPGATSESIVLRANFGYTPEGSRAETFNHSGFRDFTMKVFGKAGGRIAKLGEITVERKIRSKDSASLSKD